MVTRAKRTDAKHWQLTIHSQRPALAEIERTIQWTEANIVPSVFRKVKATAVVPSIEARHQKNCNAYFLAERWAIGDVKADGLNVCPERFPDGAEAVAESVIHEMVHLVNHANGIKDTTKNYHNAKYKDTAEQFGLIVEKGGKTIGYGYTSLGAELNARVIAELQPDASAYDLVLRELEKAKPKKTKKQAVTWDCGCTKVRASVKVDATCNACGKKFKKAK